MIGYVATGPRTKHAIQISDPITAARVVQDVLARNTDCDGALSASGIDGSLYKAVVCAAGRYKEPSGATLSFADRLARKRWRGEVPSIRLSFEFLLRDPDRAELLPYQIITKSLRYSHTSSFELELDAGRTSALGLALWWPFEDVTETFLRSHDAIFAQLGIIPRPKCWVRGMPMTAKPRPFDFDRGSLVPPPDDPVGRSLHEQVLARAGDEGPRLAYADWLTARGDPLGEMLVIQIQLQRTPSADERSVALVERARSLLASHGLRWSNVLVPRF